jgi:outer membrane immunogenic protein
VKKTALGFAAAAVLIGATAVAQVAAAGDLTPRYGGVKAPPAPAAFSWTGFYVGGNVGYGFGNASNTFGFDPLADPGGSPAGASLALNFQQSAAANGVIGGIQSGYNWQLQNVLLGIETDFQGAGQGGTVNFSGSAVYHDPVNGTLAVPATLTTTTKLDWFGTLRARVGLTNNNWLFYGTGGLAYGQVETNGTLNLASLASGCCGVMSPVSLNKSSVTAGWVVGAGVENAISGNWTWKAEYLFMDLGNASASALTPHTCFNNGGGCAVFFPGTATTTSKFTDSIVRLGMNYKFN